MAGGRNIFVMKKFEKMEKIVGLDKEYKDGLLMSRLYTRGVEKLLIISSADRGVLIEVCFDELY